MSRNKACIVVLALALIIVSGCAKKEATAAIAFNETSIKEAVVVAEPQKAVDNIYKSLKDYKAVPVVAEKIKEQLGVDRRLVIECYGNISDPNEGLADVAIILPEDSRRGDVQLALSKYKENRMAEFENYDILDAYSIAQNAVIYDQGEYVIMLMLADNDSARAIIDENIPL